MTYMTIATNIMAEIFLIIDTRTFCMWSFIMRAVPSIAVIQAFSTLLLLLSTEVKPHNENEEIMKVKVIEWTKDFKPIEGGKC